MDFTPKQYRILVVDDHKQVRSLLKEVLERMGHEVVCAGSGREALGCFQDGAFHLVITDLDMPDGDGESLARSIKEEAPDMPVFIITGNGNDLLAEDPADIIIEKPFKLDEFRNEVKNHLPA